MAPPTEDNKRYTLAEYLEMEMTAVEKHEFSQGKLRMMSGGTIQHSMIIVNCMCEIGRKLKGKPCRLFDSNLRIRIPRRVMYTYCDLLVICGKAQVDPDDTTGQTATNPRLIVEVLSPSTEAYDRGEKFHFYREIETLEEYVLVSQSDALVETFFRQTDGTWLFSAFTGIESKMVLHSLGIELELAELFEGVVFEQEEPIAPGTGIIE